MNAPKPLIAIVGRPNVGKSTLFNRLVGSRQAITDDAPGTTRDRSYGDGEWQGRTFTFVDTGGLSDRESDLPGLHAAIAAQVRAAASEADLVLMVVDAQSGPVVEDEVVADLVRRYASSSLLIANKADNPQLADFARAFFELGLGEPMAISAVHGKATGDLLDIIRAKTANPSPSVGTTPENFPRLALVGRPNVGKSTLFNTLAGRSERIASHVPHTTRDIGRARIETTEGPLELTDTAGLMRRGKSGRGLAKFSLLRTLRAINESDVAVLLIDAVEGPTVQDAHIASYIEEAGKSIVLAVNKWDVVEKSPEIQDEFYLALRDKLGFLPSPPVVFLSAVTGAKVDRLARAVYDVWRIAATDIETAELNRTLRQALTKLPAGAGRHAPKLYYATQVDTRPPTFMLFVNRADAWRDNHRRYLMNVLRDRYQLLATPIELRFRSKPPREAPV